MVAFGIIAEFQAVENDSEWLIGGKLKRLDAGMLSRQKEAARSDDLRQARTSDLYPLHIRACRLRRASLLCSAFPLVTASLPRDRQSCRL